MQQAPTFGAPTALEERLSKKVDNEEEFAKALQGGAYELFEEFEEDSPSGAASLKLQVQVMIRQGVLKDNGGDGTISEEAMARMIAGVKLGAAQAAARAKAQRGRTCGFDSEEDDDDDSDLW